MDGEKRGGFPVVAVYRRVSTATQERDGFSLEMQDDRCRHLAKAYTPEATLVDFQDAYTGRRESRPGYQRLLGAIERGELDAVVSWSHDRLCRSSVEFTRFLNLCQRKGVAIVLGATGVVSMTPAGKFMMGMLGLVAEFESANNGERVWAVIKLRTSHGYKGPGLRPFGWRVGSDRKLVPDLEEQRAVDLAVGMMARGQSWSEISEALRDLGVGTVRGGRWTQDAARRAIGSAIERRARIRGESAIVGNGQVLQPGGLLAGCQPGGGAAGKPAGAIAQGDRLPAGDRR